MFSDKTDTDKIWNIHFTHGRDRSWLGASIDVPLENPNKGIVVGTGINPFPNDNFSDWSKLKEFADDNFRFD